MTATSDLLSEPDGPDAIGATEGAQAIDLACSVGKRPSYAPSTTMPIVNITVGTRHRKDIGDIAALAAGIADVGLLHPIVVRPDGTLIAGGRRLAAFKHLDRTEIPVTVVDLSEIARGELAENAERKDFLPSEIDAIRRALEPIEKAAAEQRMKAGTPAKVSQGSGRVTDKIGGLAGVSGRTVEKIAAVVAAAEAEPEKFGHLIEEMDKTGKVDRAHKQLSRPPRPQKGNRIPKKAALAETPAPQSGSRLMSIALHGVIDVPNKMNEDFKVVAGARPEVEAALKEASDSHDVIYAYEEALDARRWELEWNQAAPKGAIEEKERV